MAAHVLDNPIWESLHGRHRPLAQFHGLAARFEPGHPPFGALAEQTPEALADLAQLAAPGEILAVGLDDPVPPLASWSLVTTLELAQMVCEIPVEGSDAGLEPLGVPHGEEMLALASATEPGPFTARTVEQGRFLGVRRDARLIAMAGERFQPPGYTELSAVCTSAEARGKGLGERLCRAITSAIQARGETAFLHVSIHSPSFATSSALYERLGYRRRRMVSVRLLERSPA